MTPELQSIKVTFKYCHNLPFNIYKIGYMEQSRRVSKYKLVSMLMELFGRRILTPLQKLPKMWTIWAN